MLKSDFIKSKIYEMLTRKWAENGNGLFGIFNHMKTGGKWLFGKWHEPDPNDLVLHLRHKLKTQMKKKLPCKSQMVRLIFTPRGFCFCAIQHTEYFDTLCSDLFQADPQRRSQQLWHLTKWTKSLVLSDKTNLEGSGLHYTSDLAPGAASSALGKGHIYNVSI